MPFGYGKIGVFATSDDIGGGKSYTRLKGPILTGQSGDTAGASNIIQPPHIVNVSTAGADMLASVVSTFASTASVLVSTSAPKGLVYITRSSGNLIAAGSTANAPVGLPGGAAGVALCWDSTKLTIAAYDPLSSAWMWPHFPSTIGDTIVWSATSS